MKTLLTHSLNHSPIDPQKSARVFIRVNIRLIMDSKLKNRKRDSVPTYFI